MLAEQNKLEQQFVALVAEQPALRNLPNKNKLTENQQQVLAVTAKLRLGTQALCRNLKVYLSEFKSTSCIKREALHVHGCIGSIPLTCL